MRATVLADLGRRLEPDLHSEAACVSRRIFQGTVRLAPGGPFHDRPRGKGAGHRVEQVVGLAYFLCGPAADQVTGVAIPIDTGWTAR